MRCDAMTAAAMMLALVPAVRIFDARQRRSYGPVDFYDLPAEAQRLDLGV